MGQRTSQPSPPARHEPSSYAHATFPETPKEKPTSFLWKWIPLFRHRFDAAHDKDLEKGDYDIETTRLVRDAQYPAKFVRIRAEAEGDYDIVEYNLGEYVGPSGQDYVGFPLIDESRTSQEQDIERQKRKAEKEIRRRANEDEWSVSYAESNLSMRSGYSQRTIKPPSIAAASTTSYVSIDPGLEILAPPVLWAQNASGLNEGSGLDYQTYASSSSQIQPSTPPPTSKSKGKEPARDAPSYSAYTTGTPPPRLSPLTSATKHKAALPSPIAEEAENVHPHHTTCSTTPSSPVTDNESQSTVLIGIADLSDSEMIRAIIAPYSMYAILRARTSKGEEKTLWKFISKALEKCDQHQFSRDVKFISVSRLMRLLRDEEPGNELGIVRYFRELSVPKEWRLQAVAKEYFDETTLPNVFVNGPKIQLRMESLPSKHYQVGNFFSAVHAIATQTMPSDCPLAEYIVILVLITKLLSRLIGQVRIRIPPHLSKILSNSISLMVAQSMSTQTRVSVATLGFSACGTSRQRKSIANIRKQNLPQLGTLENVDRITEWNTGNCAEPEVFAYIPAMKRQLRTRARQMGLNSSKIVCVGLTLKLAKLDVSQLHSVEGKEFCELCRELTQNIADELDCPILDLCPPP